MAREGDMYSSYTEQDDASQGIEDISIYDSGTQYGRENVDNEWCSGSEGSDEANLENNETLHSESQSPDGSGSESYWGYDEAMFGAGFGEYYEDDEMNEYDDMNVDFNTPIGIEVRLNIDSLQDILAIDLKKLAPADMMKYDFLNSEIAYLFYHWYGRVNGFAVRKSKKIRSTEGVVLQRNFVCHRQGMREDRGLTMENRKREPRGDFRCGCTATFRVHLDFDTNRWYAKDFIDEHNHGLEEDSTCGLIAAHRKMHEADILQMNNMLKAGVATPQIHNTFANQTGGYQKVRFSKENMYNVQAKQRKNEKTDAQSAVDYIRARGSNDPLLYCQHITDAEGNLDRLFWSDGISQLNYQIFGDVVAFDATYGKNRYKCPFVVFCGVNHHNKSTIFATALVTNEKIETYVWLLERFLEAMNGKAPASVITDGCLAMKAAIKQVFPNAFHRLCAWHLLDNAKKHVHFPGFVSDLRKCMFIEYDVSQFEEVWAGIVAKYGLGENPWVQELYDRKMMWVAAHMRGRFFAGFRTTSRCEALHSQIGKFVKKRYNLTEFVQHFQRCVNYLRYKELDSDFNSSYGKVVARTNVTQLEMSFAEKFTKNVFLLFRPVLQRLDSVVVERHEETMTCTVYIVATYPQSTKKWHVSYHEPTVDFTCSCYKMETHGLPCTHIVAVLVYLGFREAPKCLVLDRWTKAAKHAIRAAYNEDTFYWDSHNLCQYSSMVDHCHYMCNLSLVNEEEVNETRHLIAKRVQFLKNKYKFTGAPDGVVGGVGSVRLGNPTPAGRDDSTVATETRNRRRQRCSRCKVAGHNIKSCSQAPKGVPVVLHDCGGTSNAGSSFRNGANV